MSDNGGGGGTKHTHTQGSLVESTVEKEIMTTNRLFMEPPPEIFFFTSQRCSCKLIDR